jgi:hypothetical protein
MTKYCTSSSYGTVDNKTTLDASDDVASVKWGGSWRMPTKEEIEELRDKCKCEGDVLNGVNGVRVTGPNGNSIFLPTAGYRRGNDLSYESAEGYYWSASLVEGNSYNAWFFYFYNNGVHSTAYNYRFYGRSVRPVCE